jgi:RNA polymerase sigma-70 factor (ECF subfamily)
MERSGVTGISNPEARFRELHEQRDGLYRAVALAVGDVSLAAEAIDEAMTRAYARWDRIRNYDNPEGWIYRVAINWCRSAMRKRSREELREHVPEPEGIEPLSDLDLRRAVQRLPLKFRVVVVARYFQDWSTAETADALNLPIGTVKSRLKRALSRLERDLEGMDL